MQRQHKPHSPEPRVHRDPDAFHLRTDRRPHEDAPQFGPPRPDLDRGMRGGPAVGEAGAYGPRSDMMEYGGYEHGAYGRDEAVDDDRPLTPRDETKDELGDREPRRHSWIMRFRRRRSRS
jgi:hypothetical protein